MIVEINEGIYLDEHERPTRDIRKADKYLVKKHYEVSKVSKLYGGKTLKYTIEHYVDDF